MPDLCSWLRVAVVQHSVTLDHYYISLIDSKLKLTRRVLP